MLNDEYREQKKRQLLDKCFELFVRKGLENTSITELARKYNINHIEFRPYYLLYIATIHDYCLWENEDLVKEKIDCIYAATEKL